MEYKLMDRNFVYVKEDFDLFVFIEFELDAR
jgi:hypothetical protein